MATDGFEATSLRGEPLAAPTFPDDIRVRLEARLMEARTAYARQPDDADALLLLAQSTGALGRFREAIALFGQGMAKHPTDARFPRYRGHRLLSTRQLTPAIADLTAAAALVAGQAPAPEYPPGSAQEGVPTYTLQFSIWYHLGLAHYLAGDFASAASAYAACHAFAQTDETLVAVTHWRYMTLRRLGDAEAAAHVLALIHTHMQITENRPYYRLVLLYIGAATPEATLAPDAADVDKGVGNNQALMDATVGYGVGNWHWYNGRQAEGEAMFARSLTPRHREWPASPLATLPQRQTLPVSQGKSRVGCGDPTGSEQSVIDRGC